jgi:hypothetical protein
MLNIKRHVRESGPLQRSENYSVYMRRAEATRAEKTPLRPSLDFSIPALRNRVGHTPPTSERPAPKAEGRTSVSSLKTKLACRLDQARVHPALQVLA